MKQGSFFFFPEGQEKRKRSSNVNVDLKTVIGINIIQNICLCQLLLLFNRVFNRSLFKISGLNFFKLTCPFMASSHKTGISSCVPWMPSMSVQTLQRLSEYLLTPQTICLTFSASPASSLLLIDLAESPQSKIPTADTGNCSQGMKCRHSVYLSFLGAWQRKKSACMILQ